MKFSLVMATLGRSKEIGFFLKSLSLGSHSCELIIIDQNKNEMVTNIIKDVEINNLSIKHIKVDFTGLSRARNFGLGFVSEDTDFLAFPDDDCAYSGTLFDDVAGFFKDNSSIGVLSGVSIPDFQSLDCKCNLDFERKINSILNVFGQAISYTIFIRYKLIKNRKHFFDEKLGVGAYFGSTEETDYLYRLIMQDICALNSSKIRVFHPDKDNGHINYERVSYYNLGVGAFIKKHLKCNLFSFVFLFRSFLFVLPYYFLKSIFKLKLSYIKIGWLIFLSRLKGFVLYK